MTTPLRPPLATGAPAPKALRVWIYREVGEIRHARRGEFYCDVTAKVPIQSLQGTMGAVSIVKVEEQR